MNSLIALLLGFSFGATALADPRPQHEILFEPTSEKEVVVFIDFNSSLGEINAAKDAARQLGKGFATIPRIEASIEMQKKYLMYYETNQTIRTYSASCSQSNLRCELIEDLRKTGNSLMEDCRTIGRKYPFSAKSELQNLSKELNDKGLKVSHLIISGHHSGSFYGDFFVTDKLEYQAISKIAAEFPTVYKSLRFIGLWGCTTVNTGYAAAYFGLFPTLKVLAGFFGSAPSGMQPASHALLKDAIIKSGKYTKAAEPNELKRLINNTKFVPDTYFGIAVKLNEDAWFYGRSRRTQDQMDVTFQKLKSQDHCVSFLNSRYNGELEMLRGYLNGQQDLPVDGQSSPLQNIYFDFSQNFECYKNNIVHSPQQIGLLRFFPAVVSNFVSTFSRELNEAESKLFLLQNSPSVANMPSFKNFMRKYPFSLRVEIQNKGRPGLLSLIRDLRALLPTLMFNPTIGAHLRPLQKIEMLLTRYLDKVDDSCMNFAQWHEHNRGDVIAGCIVVEGHGNQLNWKTISH